MDSAGKQWCKAHIIRSQRDIRQVMALAAPGVDSVAAHEKEKAKTREKVAKHRAKGRSYVTPASNIKGLPLKTPKRQIGYKSSFAAILLFSISRPNFLRSSHEAERRPGQ